jgi:hypothetical protein
MFFRVRERKSEPGELARIRARLRGAQLDRALSEGADPSGSATLSARAQILTSHEHRDGLAAGIERMLESLDRSAPRMHLVPCRATLRANAAALRQIARTLREPGPVYAPGVARMDALVGDGTGVAYTGEPGELALELRDAQAALAGAWTRKPLRRGGRVRVRGGTPPARYDDALALQRAWLSHRHESA